MREHRLLLARFIQNPHFRRAAKLVGGSGLAQLIPILAAPIVTRLYAPSDYGILATFGAFVALVAAVATGRYCVAIVLPETDAVAKHLVVLSLCLSGVTSVLLLAACLAIHLTSNFAFLRPLGLWIFAVPAAVLLASTWETLSYLALRVDRFGTIATSNVSKAGATTSTQLAIGAFGTGSSGLLVGYFVGQLMGNGRLLRMFVRWSRTEAVTSIGALRRTALRYARFPKFDVWANLANSASFNVIMLGMGILYATSVVGQYALAYRLMALPSAIVGTAIGQTYLREAAIRASSAEASRRAFDKTVRVLAVLVVPPVTVIAIFGPRLFSFAFGSEWVTAGHIAAAMTPLVLMRFLASPISSIFHVYGRQLQLLLFQVVLLGIVAACFYLGRTLHWNPAELILIQSCAMALVYAVLLALARTFTAGVR